MATTMSMVFCCGFILVCEVAVHGSPYIPVSSRNMYSVSGASSIAVASSNDNTQIQSSSLAATLSSKPTYPDHTVKITSVGSSSLQSSSSVEHTEKPNLQTDTFGESPSLESLTGWNEGSKNPPSDTTIKSSRSSQMMPVTPQSSSFTGTTSNEPPFLPGHLLITLSVSHTSRHVTSLIAPTLTSVFTPTTPKLPFQQVKTPLATTTQVSRMLWLTGIRAEKLIQNTMPITTESPNRSGEYVAIIILSILCGIVLMMIIIFILYKHRFCRRRRQDVTWVVYDDLDGPNTSTNRYDEELSSSEVNVERGLPEGHTNMTPPASLSLDESGHTSIGTHLQNSSLQNGHLEGSAQEPNSQDIRQNTIPEFRHAVHSDYMELSYFTSCSDKKTDTPKTINSGCCRPESADSSATKDDKPKPAEDHSSDDISTGETPVVSANDKPATGTLKRPKLIYDKYGYTLVIKHGDKQFQVVEDSGQTRAIKDSTCSSHVDHTDNHGVLSKVENTATVNSPVLKPKDKTSSFGNTHLPKTKLVERLVGSNQTDNHDVEPNHADDPPMSPSKKTHKHLNRYLDLYSQTDGSCGKLGEMDHVENVATETGQHSGETYTPSLDTDIENVDECAFSTTTPCSNVTLENHTTDANPDYHSSGDDTSPEEDIDIMAYFIDYVAPQKTYLGIIYEYEEDVEFEGAETDQGSEGDDSEKEESVKEQSHEEQENSRQLESIRIKQDEETEHVMVVKEGGTEDEDTVSNLEMQPTDKMKVEKQVDTEGVLNHDQRGAAADSEDEDEDAHGDATDSCSQHIEYQGLIQTMEGVDPIVDRDDQLAHTYSNDKQEEVLCTSSDTENKGNQQFETVKGELLEEEQSDETGISDEQLATAQGKSLEKHIDQSTELQEDAVEMEDKEAEMGDEFCFIQNEHVEKLDMSRKLEDEELVEEKVGDDQQVLDTPDDTVGKEDEEDEELVEVQVGGDQQVLDTPDDTVGKEDEDSADELGNTLVKMNNNLWGEEVPSGSLEQKQVDVQDALEKTDGEGVQDDVMEKEGAQDTALKKEDILENENVDAMKLQDKFQERNDAQIREDEEWSDGITDRIGEEAENGNPGHEQAQEVQEETGEMENDKLQIQDVVGTDEEVKRIEVHDDEQEEHVKEAESEKWFKDKPYDTVEMDRQVWDITDTKQKEIDKENYASRNDDRVAEQETFEKVIYPDELSVVREKIQEGEIKEEEDEEHEVKNINNDHCEGSRDILVLDPEEGSSLSDEDVEEDDDDGWMLFDEPMSAVLSACQYSGNDYLDIDEMDTMDSDDDQPFDSNLQDDSFARDYIERLKFLQPTKGILCKGGTTMNEDKRVPKNVRFTLPGE
ncbi:interaptin-like [Haliotis cracherodii]|uniref:interaptin-like n=1 Tax=Haliotis cracherodii TaxID=6455 RepID=UPI0039E831EA